MAPLIKALELSSVLEPIIVVTGQHREMLDQVLALFDLHPSADLDVIAPRQTLTHVTSSVLQGLEPLLCELTPDAVVVQGDTTTTMAAALAAYYARIPLVHLEAGLRTGNPWSPYPEEMNRRLTTQLTGLHLAPTSNARNNLVSEGVDPKSIVVTGNTVIDSLLWTVGRRPAYENDVLEELDASSDRLLLVTAHRRESWGRPMSQIAAAVASLAARYPDLAVVVPMHRNPAVREILEPRLRPRQNVTLTDPLAYGPFARLMGRADILLTDSGGVQEEGPSLGKPVLVMRDTTERPEAVEAGTARLVGTDTDAIVQAVAELLDDPAAYDRMATAVNPYGDGLAAERSERAIARFLGVASESLDEFVPSAARSQ